MTTQRLRAGRITAAPSGLGSCPYARRTGGSVPSWKGAGYDWRRSSENYAVAGDSGSNFCRGAVLHLCAVCAGVQPVDAPDRPTALGTLGWPGNIVRGGTFSWRIWNRGSRLPAGFERYRPVLRTAVLVSFLGYMSVIAGMMYELGLPWRIWRPILMWNRHSMLFEVSWCVMLYSTVLALEFSPALVEKIPWDGVRDWYLKQQHRILIGLVLVR